ncbi:YicC/YloC family endoribonuclease [Millionella massiliensis]|uniref:YicC/YloC family endoribonuclease n=1 Tax=Millionella massiliensis TaxID=1871023 RepID=UPI0023A8601B|nr:YicC/YloC family endoribonuclease [Millionella massiliensis]
MIKSMTGYGRAERHTDQRKITVEIKSLNSKQLDLSTRIPSIYREKEYEIRNTVSKAVGRGKVDLFVTVENIAGAKTAGGSINKELFKTYYTQLVELQRELGDQNATEPLITTVLRLPDVMQTEAVVVSDQEWQALTDAVNEAVDNLNKFRIQEGEVLIKDLLKRIDTIQELAAQIIPLEGERIETVRTRLMENLKALQVNVDSNRFEQEIIYYLEKFDITEEKVRLKQHCDYFRTVAGESEGVGRKLGFIAQEMGREINTTGSKANHAGIQKIVVRMKDELEKVKEQLLNLL